MDSFYNTIPNHVLGNTYSTFKVPTKLIPHIGYVVGKNGFYLKKITEASRASFLWFNQETGLIEIVVCPTPFNHSEKNYEFEDDFVGVDEILESDLFDYTSSIVEDVHNRLQSRFERCFTELRSFGALEY